MVGRESSSRTQVEHRILEETEENKCCPLWFGIDWIVVMCSRMHGERCNRADSDG